MRSILPSLAKVEATGSPANRRLAHLRKAFKAFAGLAVIALLLTAGSILPGSVPASARLDQAYDLSRWTVDGGGGALSGSGPAGTYTLTGTAGQPDTGVWQGGDYVLSGGFWGGGGVPGPEYEYRVYLPMVIRSSP
jgi:hypothetical protein